MALEPMNEWEAHLWAVTYVAVFGGLLDKERDEAFQDRDAKSLEHTDVARRACSLADDAVKEWKRRNG